MWPQCRHQKEAEAGTGLPELNKESSGQPAATEAEAREACNPSCLLTLTAWAVLSEPLCSHPESEFWLNFPKISRPFRRLGLGISSLVSFHSRVDSILEMATSSCVHFLFTSSGPSNLF